MFIGKNDTANQPMTSGPVTADHVVSIIGVPFLQSIIYIYICVCVCVCVCVCSLA